MTTLDMVAWTVLTVSMLGLIVLWLGGWYNS